MKRQLVLTLAIVFIFVLLSCETGTPPELVLSFSLDAWQNAGLGVQVDYTLTNDGEDNLENCKIQIGIDTTNDGDYDDAGDVTYWTDGVDLTEGETFTIDNVEIFFAADAYNVTVLAAGFDNPADPKSSPGRTIIYYDK